jgi:hypothetical protein
MICDIKSVPDKASALKPPASPEHADAAHPPSVTQLGMARFFTAENLLRYRTLASERLDPDQRRTIIQALGQEMKALKAEMQSPGSDG